MSALARPAAALAALIAGIVATFVVLAACSPATHADGQGRPVPTPTVTVTVTAVPACAYEDGSGDALPCRWYADTEGNGVGRSFTVVPATPGSCPAGTDGSGRLAVYDDGTSTLDC